MKKLLFSCVAMAAFALMTSCSSSSSGDSTTPPAPPAPENAETFSANYFTAQNSTYHEGAAPAATAGAPELAVTMNDQGLASGSNLISINTADSYQKFFVGVDGVNGYIEVPAASRANTVYVITLLYGQNIQPGAFKIWVIGLTTDGKTTQPFVQPVNIVPTQTGSLHVNLTFENDKDVDLHLITPSGHDIYYGDRDISNTEGTITGGLDVDSNAGCDLDHIKSENIVLPAELIEPGVYTVEVDMWQNCDVSIATQWTINARYNGAFLRNQLTLPTAAENQTRVQNLQTDVQGSNPVYGTYPINAPSNKNNPTGRTKVMQFTILAANAAAPVLKYPYKPTDMDEMKMEESAWYRK